MVVPRSKLTEKHWQAIILLEQGVPRKEIAVRLGWSYDYFKDLCAGDMAKAGFTAELFSKEIKKIEITRDENTQVLIKENVFLAQTEIHRILKELSSKKKLSIDDKKIIATLTNALVKSKPHVEVENLSFRYVKGMTPEELIHEFTRLKSIAESSFVPQDKFKEESKIRDHSKN